LHHLFTRFFNISTMSAAEKLKTQLVITAGFIVLFVLSKRVVFIDIALGVALVSLIIPKAGDYIVICWYKLAEVLGWVNSKIILSLVFIVFIVPFSLLSKLFRKEKMDIKHTSKTSLFHTRGHKYTKEDIQEQW
jgi:hypothetical protein